MVNLMGVVSASQQQSVVRVKFLWNGTKPNHLSLKKDQLVVLKERGDGGWWLGETEGKVTP